MNINEIKSSIPEPMGVIGTLILFTGISFLLRIISKPLPTQNIASFIKSAIMMTGRFGMMILMAIPEQVVAYIYEPHMSIFKRLTISFAMYAIHFAYNGFVMKPAKSYNELVWIIGTALYAWVGLGVKNETVTALLAADSIMVLFLRGL